MRHAVGCGLGGVGGGRAKRIFNSWGRPRARLPKNFSNGSMRTPPEALGMVKILHRHRRLRMVGISYRRLGMVGISYRPLGMVGITYRRLGMVGISYRHSPDFSTGFYRRALRSSRCPPSRHGRPLPIEQRSGQRAQPQRAWRFNKGARSEHLEHMVARAKQSLGQARKDGRHAGG
jgi:hypothetical protein